MDNKRPVSAGNSQLEFAKEQSQGVTEQRNSQGIHTYNDRKGNRPWEIDRPQNGRITAPVRKQ